MSPQKVQHDPSPKPLTSHTTQNPEDVTLLQDSPTKNPEGVKLL